MGLNALNHYTIKPVDLEATKDFYVDLLGLEVGYRPPLAFPGYWLYCGGNPTVHLIGPKVEELGGPAREPGPTGLFDHIAFSCTGLKEMRERLDARGVRHEVRVIPRDRQTQIFMHDPDGVAVELNFPSAETPPDAATRKVEEVVQVEKVRA
ncbi:VOC family protein [Roseomonas sp. NAR14]|uniref:VOC family protein n=1 Tax=Roseomonas acroporae TaxID=2937791 RepID=A0A9X1Y6R0_9PROT|nr:VOC family protein [Roseomonas acroporae]MCK8784162.1 VOC family protein [Roseomonas acroporae]